MADKPSPQKTEEKKPATPPPSAPVTPEKKEKNKKKKMGAFSILLPIILAIGVIIGVWVFLVKKDFMGIGEKLRPKIKDIPIVREMLPPAKDPEAAFFLGYDQLVEKYDANRKKIDDLNKKNTDLEKQISDLEKQLETAKKENLPQVKRSLEQEKKSIEEEKKQLALDKKNFFVAIQNKDPEGFAVYYEKIDAENAKLLYEKSLKEREINAEIKTYISKFENMDATSAAKILEQMLVNSDSLVVNILRQMKSDVSAEILAAMDSINASTITEKMAEKYPKLKKNN